MKPLTVTIIQADLLWENKNGNLEAFQEKIAALTAGTELVLLPEMFSTGFSMNAATLGETVDGDTVSWMRQTAVSNKIILTGSIIIREGDNYYNRLIWMLPNGEYGFYDKRHLFGYGKETDFFTAGSKRLIASAKGWRINLQVCYDLRFPVWARQSGNETPEYDLLIYVANWPARRSHAWKTLLCARAIENQCYVIGVNRTGIDGNNLQYSGDSMIIDPLGEILYACADREETFTLMLNGDHLEEVRRNFPFLKDGDPFHLPS